jgi:hypothetical protein
MSDPRKRAHTLLTDAAVAGLPEHEREELELLLDGAPADPSYEQAAAAIALSLMGELDQVERMPVAVEASILDQASRYWGFAEARPREPTLGAGDLLLASDEHEAAPVRRHWERSSDRFGGFDSIDEAIEAGVLESSLTQGRIDRLDVLDSIDLVDTVDPVDPVAQVVQAPNDEDPEDSVITQTDDTLDDRPLEPPRDSWNLRIPRILEWATYTSAIAALLFLAVALWLFAHRDTPPDPTITRVSIEGARDKLEWSFRAKPDAFVGEGAGGSVLWSTELQRGVLNLRGLAVNDPSTAQYQLWIVDLEREGPRVDGGVFNVPADEDEVVIPIDAKLLVGEPGAFVITVERPGGVVVSGEQRVVMVAVPDA